MPYIKTMSAKDVPWLNFDLITGEYTVVYLECVLIITWLIGPNSDFHTETLSKDQIEELGGVEYKALTVLGWGVPVVSLLVSRHAL